MKKLLVFLVVCALTAGGYYGYQLWQNKKTVNDNKTALTPTKPKEIKKDALENIYPTGWQLSDPSAADGDSNIVFKITNDRFDAELYVQELKNLSYIDGYDFDKLLDNVKDEVSSGHKKFKIKSAKLITLENRKAAEVVYSHLEDNKTVVSIFVAMPYTERGYVFQAFVAASEYAKVSEDFQTIISKFISKGI